MEDTACDALSNWSYDPSTKMWSKPGAEPLREDKFHGLELQLAERWDGMVEEANQLAALPIS